MKKLFYILSLILLLGLANSCNRDSALPTPHAVVIKFKHPEYKDYILANYFKGEDFIFGMRYNRCIDPIGQAGFSPYWELPDDWLLVDWKWFSFPYDAGLVLLNELTWDKFEIDATNISGIPKWPLTEPHIIQPVEKIYYINARHLEEFSGQEVPDEIIYILLGGEEFDDCDCGLCDQPERMDRLWSILQNNLSIVINNGNLEELAKME